MREILSLSPPLLWRHFYEISQIPRCSGDEDRVRDYVVSVAKAQGASYRIDAAGNLVVNGKPSPGREGDAVTVLQSHLDMVCEKDGESGHDFSTAPLTLKRAGDWVSAHQTTLGADNGLGVAAALAVLEETGLAHGPLELLFTVDEESGLTGATALAPDMLTGRVLINLDTEEHGSLYIGCAGGRDTEISLNTVREPVPTTHRCVRVKLGGLRGGHSGIDIHEGRGNALKLLIRFLSEEGRRLGLRLAAIDGGSKHNAIPRESEAVVLVHPSTEADLEAAVIGYDKTLKEEWGRTEPSVSVGLEAGPAGMPHGVFSPADQDRVLDLLAALPHGVIAMSEAVEGLVQTSTNLAVAVTEGDRVRVLTSQRSSREPELVAICNRVAEFGRRAGAQIDQGPGYPPWPPDLTSPLLSRARQVFRRVFGAEAQVKAVHAGLECGIIGAKFVDMDMISFGPTILGAHSPSERVHIPSVADFWTFLKAMLEAPAP